MTVTVPFHCLAKVAARNSLSSHRCAYRILSSNTISGTGKQPCDCLLGDNDEHRLMRWESTARSNSQGSRCQLSVQMVGLTPADTNVNVVNIHQSGSFLTS